MCKSKCAGGLPTCNPTGCSNAQSVSEMLDPGFAVTVRKADGVSTISFLNPNEIAMGPYTKCVLGETFKSQGGTWDQVLAATPVDAEVFACERHRGVDQATQADNAIRYEVYVAKKPLVWGSEPVLGLKTNSKVIADNFAQKMADSGEYGMVLLEAYRGDTEILILGKVVKPSRTTLPNTKQTAPAVIERMRERSMTAEPHAPRGLVMGNTAESIAPEMAMNYLDRK